MGPSIIYSEQSNEELEALFRTIIDDDEFLSVCQNKFNHVDIPREKFAYDEISNTNQDQLKDRIVHEINMSVYYNIEVDRNNSDVTYVHRTINVLPESNKNRFSNLNLSNDIDRFIQMHDYVHHHSPSEKKPSIKQQRRTTTTIAAINETHEYDSAFLEDIVERQLQAARRAEQANQFTPIVNQPPPSTIQRTKFVRPPIFIPKIDHIEYPKTNLNHLPRRPLTFIDNLLSQPIQSKEKPIIREQQGILSTASTLSSSTIPDNIKTIELMQIPTRKSQTNEYQDFHLIGYETIDDHLHRPLRRTKSVKQINKSTTPSSTRRSSTIVTETDFEKSMPFTSPLKSIKRHFRQKNETAHQNKSVSREKSKGKTIRNEREYGQ